MKKLLLTSLIVASALSASAAIKTIEWSYATDPCTLSAIGSGQAEEQGAAMLFDAPDLTGMQIVHIDAYLNADESTLKNIRDTQLFMTEYLTTGTPTIMISDVEPTMSKWSGEATAVLSYDLPTPYLIGDAPIYVGYYLTVTKVAGDGERYPILLDKRAVESDGFFYISPSVTEGQWSNDYYTSGSPIIVLTVQYEEYTNGLGIINPEPAYTGVGEKFDVLLTLSNGGTKAVENLSYTYNLNGGTPVTKTLTFDTPLAPRLLTPYDVLFPIDPVEEAGVYTMEFAITEVNGQPNEATMGSSSFEVNVFPYMPQHRILVEEFTALPCGFCPRGYVAMEYVSENYPEDAIVICYHNDNQGADPMSVTNSMPLFSNSNPNSCIDREKLIDPYYGNSYNNYLQGIGDLKDLGILDDLDRAMANVAIADIEVVKAEVADSVINVTTNVTFMKEVPDDYYRVGYVLKCDGLWNATWGQTNYFTHDNNYKDTPLIQQFYRLPGTVYGLTFNDVAINVNAMRGLSRSIMEVEAGIPVVNEYSFDVSNVKNTAGVSMNPYLKIEKMEVVAFVINRLTGTIVNACSYPVSNVYDAVESIYEDAEVISTTYYDLAGRRVANPDRGIYIKSDTMSDGSVRSSKVVIN